MNGNEDRDKDKYDEAIEILSDVPDEILDAWNDPSKHRAGCLFAFVTNDGEAHASAGCLSMILDDRGDAVCSKSALKNDALTELIQRDKRIPLHSGDIEVSDLHVFAQWQRFLDGEVRNKSFSITEIQSRMSKYGIRI